MKISPSRIRRSRGVGVLIALSATVALAACGNPNDGDGPDAQWKASGSLTGDGQVVVFMPSGGLAYNKNFERGVTDVLKDQGYSVKVFTNAYDQAEQDRQVQQYIATGARPAGILFYPPAPEAAKNSARQLVRLAPVAWGSTTPSQAPSPFGGNSQAYSGELMAGSYVELRMQLEGEGVDLPNDGRILVYNAPVELAAGAERLKGFTDKLDADGVDYEILGEENGMVDRDTGYQLANGSLAKYGDDFDIVWALNLTGAEGVAQALREHGREPGEDVYIVSGGDCTGGLAAVEAGSVYSTVGQSGSIEGRVAARSLVQLISHGEATDEDVQLEPDPELPPLEDVTPPLHAYSPQVPITADSISSVRLWGEDADTICGS